MAGSIAARPSLRASCSRRSRSTSQPSRSHSRSSALGPRGAPTGLARSCDSSDGPSVLADWSATLAAVPTFSAATALPFEHRERATFGLRAELRRQLLAADVRVTPRWETFAVCGPHKFKDLRDHTWYEYRGSVESRGPFDRNDPAGQPE